MRFKMHQRLSTAINYWHYIAPIVKYPKNNKEFNILVSQLDALLEIACENEQHSLMSLIDLISHLIAFYEQKNFPPPPAVKGVEGLKFLMDSHHLSQKDLPEIASQGVLSEILQKKRALNIRQIKLLSKRFGVDPSTFIDDE